MVHRARILLFALSVWMGVVSATCAVEADGARRWQASIRGGGAWLDGIPSAGFLPSASVTFWRADDHGHSAGFELGVLAAGTYRMQSEWPEERVRRQERWYHAGPAWRWQRAEDPRGPFVCIGLGPYLRSAKEEPPEGSGSGIPLLIASPVTEWSFGLNLGGGLRFATGGLSPVVEARVHAMLPPRATGIGVGVGVDLQ